MRFSNQPSVIGVRDPEILMHLGALCRKARESLDLSRDEFCELAQLPVSELVRFESDPRQRAPGTVGRVAAAFRLCRDELGRKELDSEACF